MLQDARSERPLKDGVTLSSRHSTTVSESFSGGWTVFAEDVLLQLCGAARDSYRPLGLVASALFQTDLLPS